MECSVPLFPHPCFHSTCSLSCPIGSERLGWSAWPGLQQFCCHQVLIQQSSSECLGCCASLIYLCSDSSDPINLGSQGSLPVCHPLGCTCASRVILDGVRNGRWRGRQRGRRGNWLFWASITMAVIYSRSIIYNLFPEHAGLLGKRWGFAPLKNMRDSLLDPFDKWIQDSFSINSY